MEGIRTSTAQIIGMCVKLLRITTIDRGRPWGRSTDAKNDVIGPRSESECAPAKTPRERGLECGATAATAAALAAVAANEEEEEDEEDDDDEEEEATTSMDDADMDAVR